MKIGTVRLQYNIEDILFRNHVIGSRRRIAKEIVEAVMDAIGDDGVKSKSWDLAHNFPAELEPFVDRLKKGLKLGEVSKSEEAVEIYRWLLDQERGGRDLNVFFAWATSDEQIKYVTKYFSKPMWLKVDFERAYAKTKVTVVENSDGSIYV